MGTLIASEPAIFGDTSALVAILAKEQDASRFTTRIEAAQERFTSGVVILEAAMRLSILLGGDPTSIERLLQETLDEAGTSVLPIDGAVARHAVAAFAAFGKGRHPVRLNLADCLSYACARANGLAVLYKGEDFAATDIAAA